jgi:hypothetical protein
MNGFTRIAAVLATVFDRTKPANASLAILIFRAVLVSERELQNGHIYKSDDS